MAGDTGALHVAQAVNSRLPYFLRPNVICLGHDQTSGDIRYADPGIFYVVRLKSQWNKKAEKAALQKRKLLPKNKLLKIIGMPYDEISIDEPIGAKYLERYIYDSPNSIPFFSGAQIYSHTLLRNIFKKSRSSCRTLKENFFIEEWMSKK